MTWLGRLALVSITSGVVLLSVSPIAAQTAATWLPVSKEELDLKDNPLQPGETAMALYREIQTDSAKSLETHYHRIKIFKEEGKKYADVEIPYIEGNSQVEDIRARSVSPDGQSVDFGGAIFDKVVVKTRRFKMNVKTFTLANVQAGSIIEYAYRVHWHHSVPDVFRNPQAYILNGTYAYPAALWTIPRSLFIRRAHLVMRPFSPTAHLEFRAIMLPNASEPRRQLDGTVQLDVENIPAFHEEEHSPPEDALESRVYFFYVVGYFSNERYWRDLAKRESHQLDKFLSRSRAVEQEAARLAATSDSPEAKLRKLYERVQQIRYVSFEPSKTEKERKRENLKANKNVEEVLTRGYAFANEINLLFVALAREAGFQAFPVRVTARNQNFFRHKLLDPAQLDAEVVEVELGAKSIYLDPATLHCPFGLLPWEESDTGGIRLHDINPGVVQTPPPRSADAVIERRANLKLDKDGSLQGKVEVNFIGQEALSRRIAADNQDEQDRRKSLEEEIRKWLPPGATVKLGSASGWAGPEGPLQAVFEVQIPNYGAPAGERLLVPLVLFQTRLKKSLQSSRRENTVYLKYGYQEHDELRLEIPQGYKVENLPTARSGQQRLGSYDLSPEQQGTQLKIQRNLSMDRYFFPVEFYPELQNFNEYVRGNDDEQAILRAR